MCREVAWTELTAKVTSVSDVRSRMCGLKIKPPGVFANFANTPFFLEPAKSLYYNYKMGVVYPDMGVVGNLE